MFRFTPAKLSMSPYVVFLKDIRRKAAPNTKLTAKQIKQKYHSLDEKQKAVYVRRARARHNPNLDTFNMFQKRHAKNFTYLPMNSRSRVVGVLFRQYKAGKPLNFAAAVKEAKRIARRAQKKLAPAKGKGKKQVKAKARALKEAEPVAEKKVVVGKKAGKPAVGKKARKVKKTKKARKTRRVSKTKRINKLKKVKKTKKTKKAKKAKKAKRAKRSKIARRTKRVKRTVVGKKTKKSTK